MQSTAEASAAQMAIVKDQNSANQSAQIHSIILLSSSVIDKSRNPCLTV